tara:strand:+ start:22518 stop:22745 length:228 start_codon:yes stop_codon:yes gene_type:complete
MSTNRTVTLSQLDALCHALDDYLAHTLDEHYKYNSAMKADYREIRSRLMSAYQPLEAQVWAIKAFTNISIETVTT